MKNLFKKMMLVAVAAMAFVACSQDNDEINATVKKTDVVFNLSIEDVTRAYFGEEQGSGSDTSFPSYWSGNESVTLVAYDANDVVLSTAWGSIEAEGEQATQARVAATFNDDLTGVAKVRAYVGSWGYDEPRVPEVGQDQYMEKEGTVAANAHTMSAEAEWDGVAQSIDLNFSHAVAYGRMQIKGIVGIDDVNDVTITKAIVKVDEAEYQVRLSSELDTKYIWFACDADEAIETLDIEVKASNGHSYVKTIDMTAFANRLKFRTGEVSKFAVSGLTEKPADYTLNLNKVVARTGNTITFQGDEEDDKWTVIFNDGLTEIAEGVYQGVHGAAWSNESALEYDYFNSNFYLAAVPAEYPYYADNAAINVSVEGGIYTISAFVTSYIGGPDKTVQISYVGDLSVEESGGDEPVNPEPSDAPKFVRAAITNDYGTQDKEITFYGNGINLYDLSLDFIGTFEYLEDESVILKEGVYDADVNKDSLIGTSYSSYNGGEVWDLTVTVSHVSSGYYIVVENVTSDEAGNNIVITKATYTGEIEGLAKPQVSGGDEPEQNAVLELVSASATHSASNMIGGTGYDLTFTDANGNTIFYRVQTKDHNYLREGDWNGDFGWAVEGFVDAVSWPGVGHPWPYSMTVAVVDGEYDITLQTADLDNGNKAYTAHYKGQIEGFTLPVEEEPGEGGNEDDTTEVEFVIPGEGGAYAMDYRYTKLVDGLDAANGIRVAQDNGWIWDIKFNSGLASIEAGDYTAVHYFSSETALEVDTYNGGFQNMAFNYIYPDEYDKVTTFNVQKQGDIYCITMIGSGGYGNDKGMFRCVYIGKIK